MRKLLFIGLLVLLLAGTAAWFEPTCVVRGKLRGEAFFNNRPTSYWQNRLESDSPIDQDEAPRQLTEGKASAVPVLIELTRSKSASVRVQAVGLLAKLKNEADAATDTLLALLSDPDSYVRNTAIRALGEIHPNDPRVVPALLEKLTGDEKAIAIRPLAEYKSGAKAAVPRLIELLENDSDPDLQWEAARALGKIGPDAQPATPALIRALKASNGTLREHAAEALGEIHAEIAVPELTAALDDPDPRVRRDAVRSLGELGAAAKPALAKIELLCKADNPDIRQAATQALRRIDPSRPAPKDQ